MVMLYAHTEGFCKIALLLYVKALNSFGFRRSKACDELIASSLESVFHALKFGDKKRKVFKSPLPADEKLHLLSCRRDFINEFESMLRNPLVLPDTVVNTEDNLGSLLLRRNLYRLGLPPDSLSKYDASLDELRNRRNNIAHGIDDAGVRLDDYTRLQAAVYSAMDSLALSLLDALETGAYLRLADVESVETLASGEMR